MPNNDIFRWMTHCKVADKSNPLQNAWERYLKAEERVKNTASGTPERTQAEKVRNTYANNFVLNCTFYDPKTGGVYEGAQAKNERVFRLGEGEESKTLYVGVLGGDVKNTMYFPMTVGRGGELTLSNEPVKLADYTYGLLNYLLQKNPTLSGNNLKEYIKKNYEDCPELVSVGSERDERSLAVNADPRSALRTAWNKFKDLDKLYSDPNSEYLKNHTPEQIEIMRADYNLQRQQAFREFVAYAEFIEPSTGRVIPKNETVWNNRDLVGKDGEPRRNSGRVGFRSEKGYLLVRDPNGDPIDGQVFKFKRDGKTFTLDETPLYLDDYTAGYAKYVQSKTDLSPYDFYGKILDNISVDKDHPFTSAKNENGLTDEMLEAAGEFFNGIGSLENNPTFVENGAPVFTNYIEENAPVFTNYIEESKPLVSNFIETGKPVITRYIEEGEAQIQGEMKEFLGHELNLEPAPAQVKLKASYVDLLRQLSAVDKSMFPSQEFTDMVNAFKELRNAGKEHPTVKKEALMEVMRTATKYKNYKAPGGDESKLSDYEKSRVEFAKALDDFAKAGMANAAVEEREMSDKEVLFDFHRECRRRARTINTFSNAEELERNERFFANGVEAISKISSMYPADSKMHSLCKQTLTDVAMQNFQEKMLSAAGIEGPATAENISRLDLLGNYGKKYAEIAARADEADKLMTQTAADKSLGAKLKAAEAYNGIYDRLNAKLDAANNSTFGSEQFEKMVKAFKSLKDLNKMHNRIEMQVGFSTLADAANSYLDYKVPEGKQVKLSDYEQSRVDIARALVKFGRSGVNAIQRGDLAANSQPPVLNNGDQQQIPQLH